MVWYAGQHPDIPVHHLELCMRQSGRWTQSVPLDMTTLIAMLEAAVAMLDVDQA